MNITSKQWFQIISGINGGLITGAALLQTLFGQDLTIKIVAVLGIIGIIINSIGTTFSGQANLVRDVRNMDGVQHIEVNEKASPTLAALAMDPTEPKIAPSQAAAGRVEAIAEGRA